LLQVLPRAFSIELVSDEAGAPMFGVDSWHVV